jgi:hypothetical protein
LRKLRFIAVFAGLSLASCAVFHPAPVWRSTLSDEHQELLQSRLAAAGSNRAELERAFEMTPQKLHPYVALLIERMPAVDLAACSASLLARTVILCDSLRNILPYAATIPEEIFRDYVLPLRVSQEPLEDFRPYFISQLLPLVRDCADLEAAALAVNRWCGSKVKFRQTQRRDQGPFETLKSGYGRCEELMIFFSDACRSVCIPVREAWTPWWMVQDNNHAWTEVWTSAGWKYAGAAEPADHLNEAWFTEPARRAALVLAAKQGEPLPGEKPYKSEDRYSLINVTENYTAVSTATISLTEKRKPAPQRQVYINLFNYGALRPIAKLQTDEQGIARIALGKGDYWITTGGDQPVTAFLHHCPPQESHLKMDLAAPEPIPKSFWLRVDP